MGDVMLFGVLRMPYDMAMADEFTRYQYHQRGLQAADAIEALQAKLHDMHRRAQTAEAALREPIEAAAPERRTLGRVLANAAFYAEHDRAEALQAQLAEARDKALEDAAMLMQRHGFGGSAAAIRAMKGERG